MPDNFGYSQCRVILVSRTEPPALVPISSEPMIISQWKDVKLQFESVNDNVRSSMSPSSDIPLIEIESSSSEGETIVPDETVWKNAEESLSLFVASPENFEISETKVEPLTFENSGIEMTDSQLEDTTMAKIEVSEIPTAIDLLNLEEFQSENNQRSLQCPLCVETFEDPQSAQIHLRKIHHRWYRCRHCRASYTSQSALDEHTKVHTSSVYFECSLCQMIFKSLPGLKQHRVRVHSTGEPKFECDHCGNRYKLKIDLVNHMKCYHTVVKYSNCRYCGKKVKKIGKHEWLHHAPVVDVTGSYFSCKICKKKFRSNNRLMKHTMTHFSRRYTCDICGLKVPELDSHKRYEHSDRNGLTCPICKKNFGRRNNFYQHVLTHSGIRPYKCNVCDATFVQRMNLIRHRKLHPGIKPLANAGITPVAEIARKFLLQIAKSD